MNDTPTVVGAFVTVILAFLGISKIMLNQATKDRDADRAERLKLADAIELMAENSGKQTEATENGFDKLTKSSDRAANEAKERNGHLGEMASRTLEAVNKVLDPSTPPQHIETQVVDTQVVKNDSTNPA